MLITRIRAYQLDLPLAAGDFYWASGKSIAKLDSTVVRLDTDKGLVGWGEVCPLGDGAPAFAAGARAGIAAAAPALIGADPTQVVKLRRLMDDQLKGHSYAKSALDIAAWDILGQAAGLPICELLGGRFGDDFPLYRAISQDTPEEMAAQVLKNRAEGYRRFQLKLGGHPDQDIDRIFAVAEKLKIGDKLIADANGGWLKHEAIRVVRAVGEVDVYIEQPCETYEQCLSIRRRTDHPFILDETVDGIDMLLRANADQGMDVANLKLSAFGGLTLARQARDLCVSFGLGMTIEDAGGGDIITAAVAHLAHSTPPEFLFTATDLNGYVTKSFAAGAPRREGGNLAAPTAPGLGVTPDEAALGEAMLDVGRA